MTRFVFCNFCFGGFFQLFDDLSQIISENESSWNFSLVFDFKSREYVFLSLVCC